MKMFIKVSFLFFFFFSIETRKILPQLENISLFNISETINQY